MPISAVKTIIVGIGTEGYLVSELVARRLETNFGSIDKVPWVRFLIMDTENVSTKRLGHMGLASHVGLSQDAFKKVIEHPSDFDASIDLTRWAGDATCFGAVAPTDGANNIRPLGRLCFLYPDNFVGFASKLFQLSNELVNLSDRVAGEKCGTAVSFAEIDQRDIIQIYVVGTTTGGTGSGSLIDVGFCIRNAPFLNDQCKVVGIISIPPRGNPNSVYNANAYAALTELSHFYYPRSVYSAKFPSPNHFPEAVKGRGMRPFHECVVVQPSTPDQKGLNMLRRAVSEYIALSAYGPIVSNLGALFADKAVFAGVTEDGKPMDFNSIGVATIEYPADHIIEGCFARLFADASSSLLQPVKAEDIDVGAILHELKISPEDVQKLFVETAEGQALINAFKHRAELAAENARRGDIAAINGFLVDLAGMDVRGKVEEWKKFAGEHAPGLFEVGLNLANSIASNIGMKLAEKASDPAYGLNWCRIALDKLEAHIHERLGQIAAPNTEIGVRAEFHARVQDLRAAARAFAEKKGCWPFGKKKDVEEAKAKIVGGADTAVRVGLAVQSEIPEQVALQKIQAKIGMWRQRLTGGNGAERWLTRLRDGAENLYKERNENGPILNGHAFFERNETLAEALKELFPTDLDRNNALSQLRSYIGGAIKTVFEENSRFDFAPEPVQEELFKVQRQFDHLFARLRNKSVVEMLAASGQMDTIVNDAKNKSCYFLDVGWERNPLGPPIEGAPNRNPLLIAFKGADNPEPAGHEANILAMFGNWKRSNLDDPTKMYLIQGLMIYSLHSMRATGSWAPYYTRDKHTRKDIAWRPLDGSPVDKYLAYNTGMLLAAMAAGIVQEVADSLRFEVPAGPYGGGGGWRTLPKDLADASYFLTQNKEYQTHLDNKTKEYIRSNRSRFLDQLKVFMNEIPDRGITYEGENLWVHEAGARLSKGAFNRVQVYLEQFPNLLQDYLALFPGYRPPTIEDLRITTVEPGKEHLLGAYECPHCKAIVGLSSDPPERVPKECPTCGWKLRWSL